eukprot:gnl/MRDRNA2_/MRDRNA2_45306_c0_seq1.p1 gnl/MRDRNA2_/MRDRNA2_45306_c0~~gnl/MRDRNA2_/MRDRNA2_45306_c0_seq1.p1  ORF type:complete len:190 (-),score=33.57 gnl/MRDRNA2_/MRDRNA2_45306_c0_seq1:177-746(-)
MSYPTTFDIYGMSSSGRPYKTSSMELPVRSVSSGTGLLQPASLLQPGGCIMPMTNGVEALSQPPPFGPSVPSIGPYPQAVTNGLEALSLPQPFAGPSVPAIGLYPQAAPTGLSISPMLPSMPPAPAPMMPSMTPALSSVSPAPMMPSTTPAMSSLSPPPLDVAGAPIVYGMLPQGEAPGPMLPSMAPAL